MRYARSRILKSVEAFLRRSPQDPREHKFEAHYAIPARWMMEQARCNYAARQQEILKLKKPNKRHLQHSRFGLLVNFSFSGLLCAACTTINRKISKYGASMIGKIIRGHFEILSRAGCLVFSCQVLSSDRLARETLSRWKITKKI